MDQPLRNPKISPAAKGLFGTVPTQDSTVDLPQQSQTPPTPFLKKPTSYSSGTSFFFELESSTPGVERSKQILNTTTLFYAFKIVLSI